METEVQFLLWEVFVFLLGNTYLQHFSIFALGFGFSSKNYFLPAEIATAKSAQFKSTYIMDDYLEQAVPVRVQPKDVGLGKLLTLVTLQVSAIKGR